MRFLVKKIDLMLLVSTNAQKRRVVSRLHAVRDDDCENTNDESVQIGKNEIHQLSNVCSAISVAPLWTLTPPP